MFLALLYAAAVLLGSLLTYGMVTALIVHLVVRLIESGYSGLAFWKNVAGMVIVWARYVGVTGRSIGMRSFGASAPLKDLVKKFSFTAEHVVAAAREQLASFASIVGSK